MRIILISLLIAVVLTGCSDDIPVNSAVIQGTKDTIFWKASAGRAAVQDNGTVKFTGFKGDDRLELTISQNSLGTFSLGPDEFNLAEYFENDVKTFSSLNDGAGEIVIDEIKDDNYYGSFRFKAGNLQDSTELVFTKGVLYEVPIYEQAIDTTQPQPVVVSDFACKINGTNFQVQASSSDLVGSNVSGYGSTRTVIVRIAFPRSIEPGTYELSDIKTSDPYRAGYTPNGIETIVQSGTLVIESNNIQERSVGGTFNFIAAGGSGTQVSISDGKFGFNY